MNNISVLLIDDHQLFLEGLSTSLNKLNFIEVKNTFSNGNSALKYLQKHPVDLVITDISMPDMNGIELIKKLKKLQPTAKTLVISMFKPLHNETGFYDGYLLKDASLDEVTKAIKTIVWDEKSYFFDQDFKAAQFEFKNNIVTKREKEIIRLITEEKTVDEIAALLFLSKHTVETHKKNIYNKLQIKTSAGLVKLAIKLGIIT